MLNGIRLTVVLTFLFCSSLIALAGNNVYRYQDDNGRWVFTDDPHRADHAEQLTLPVFETERSGYGLYLQEDGSSVAVYVYNTLPVPVQVKLQQPQAGATIEAQPELPLEQVIDPGEESVLTSLQSNPTASGGLAYRFVMGDPTAQHQPAQGYRLPFLPGDRYRISQAFNGQFSHSSDYSRYAVDIAMPLDSIVCAARDGVVVQIENANYLGGPDAQQYGSKANIIRIVHDDGTLATYAHLRMSTISLDIGDSVEAGQVIARSGNTGFSTGPHLHFVVHRNAGMKMVSVPFAFTTGTPYRGQWLSFDE